MIRAATLRAINRYNWEIYGIKDGTLGLMKRPVDAIKLSTSFFDGNLVRMGGTFLGSNNKGNPFGTVVRHGKRVQVSNIIVEGFKSLQLDALI